MGKLIDAVKEGNSFEVAELLKSGVNVNEHGEEQNWTPLCYAAGQGNVKIIKILLDCGADPFLVGDDYRTPYKIALAASHIEAAHVLSLAEEATKDDRIYTSSKHGNENRVYCRAYTLHDLRQYIHYDESLIGDSIAELTDSTVVFLHQDYSVTLSASKEEIIISTDSIEWKEFCRNKLNFHVPTDFELLS